MSRKAQQLQCTEGERKVLEEWARSRTQEARMVERARIILGCLADTPIVGIARELNIRPNTVID